MAYFAGLFNGEGCIVIAPSGSKSKEGYCKLAVRCLVSNNNLPILQLLRVTFGGSIHIEIGNMKRGYRESYQWYISSASAMNFLRQISPFLRIKKAKADVAFEFEKQLMPRGGGSKRLTNEQKQYRELLRIKMREV